MDAFEMCITGPCVEVVGDGTPAMIEVQVHRSRGVVGVENNPVVHDVVGGVKRVKGRSCAVDEPEHVGALQAIGHAASVGVGVGPVRPRLIFDGVGNAVAVKIVRLDVVGRVVLRVGSVEVFRAIVHAALVAVKVRRAGHPNVLRAVGDADVDEVASGGVFEVVVDSITVVVEQIGARLVRVGVVLDFVEIVHAVSIAVGDARVGTPPERTEQFLPVGQSVPVAVFVVVVAVLLSGPERTRRHGVGVAEGAVSVGDVAGGA